MNPRVKTPRTRPEHENFVVTCMRSIYKRSDSLQLIVNFWRYVYFNQIGAFTNAPRTHFVFILQDGNDLNLKLRSILSDDCFDEPPDWRRTDIFNF